MTNRKIEDYIPIAALNQYAYCPHRCWRMFCAGGFEDNQYTLEGTGLHDRVHCMGSNHREETWQVRAVWLKSDRYGLIGKSDLIEEQNGALYPVEYKRGKQGEFDNDALQVGAQALCLEEMCDRTISQGFVYYAHSHQRKLVEIDESLRESVISTLAKVREILISGKMPLPVYSSRCRGCSLYRQCLPQAAKKVGRYREVA